MCQRAKLAYTPGGQTLIVTSRQANRSVTLRPFMALVTNPSIATSKQAT